MAAKTRSRVVLTLASCRQHRPPTGDLRSLKPPHHSFTHHRVTPSLQRRTGEMSWMSTDMSATPNTDADGNSSEMSYTSSLQYLNSQLVAHGFAHNPGISLDGLSTPNTESVVKVLLSLLNQRVVRFPPFVFLFLGSGLTNSVNGGFFCVFASRGVCYRGIWRGLMS